MAIFSSGFDKGMIFIVIAMAKEDNGDFKIQRSGRQRECQKSNRFIKQNNNFAHASHFFVHFFLFFA